MLKFVFFLLASFVTSNMALADSHESDSRSSRDKFCF